MREEELVMSGMTILFAPDELLISLLQIVKYQHDLSNGAGMGASTGRDIPAPHQHLYIYMCVLNLLTLKFVAICFILDINIIYDLSAY